MSETNTQQQPSTSWAFLWEFMRSSKAGWILCAILLFLLLFIIAMKFSGVDVIDITRGRLGATSKDNPLQIKGQWTYKTYLKNERNPQGIGGIEEVMGLNSIEISTDKIGYTMSGLRTHYKKLGESDFRAYDPPLPLDFSRISYSADGKHFFFYFNVEGEGKEGFVKMDIDPENKAKMSGNIHYLNNDYTWTLARIVFEKNNVP
jgi:hypothetical protein